MRDPANRDIAFLAGFQILCFVALTQLEPRFRIIHLYELIPYLAILLFIAFRKDRWAYMIGPLVSVAWIGLAGMSGLFDSAVSSLRAVSDHTLAANAVSVLALLTAAIAVAIIFRCRVHWTKELAGQGLARQTFILSLVFVAGYYTVLFHWFWDMIPNVS